MIGIRSIDQGGLKVFILLAKKVFWLEAILSIICELKRCNKRLLPHTLCKHSAGCVVIECLNSTESNHAVRGS
jgi:hypothetical protein